jgi:hypothetical protein
MHDGSPAILQNQYHFDLSRAAAACSLAIGYRADRWPPWFEKKGKEPAQPAFKNTSNE